MRIHLKGLEVARTARAVAVLAAFACIAACTQQPLPGVDPTPPRQSPPPPTPESVAAPLPADTIEGPAAQVSPVGSGQAAVPDSEIVRNEENAVDPGVSEAQRQRDLNACYNFANGQVRRDEQIRDDRAGLFDNDAYGGNIITYERNIAQYNSEQLFSELFSNCMESRGYGSNRPKGPLDFDIDRLFQSN